MLIEPIIAENIDIHRRVNELGLSEAIIQRQGQTHINIDLPGIQDIQRAKDIIGNTATLSFHIVTSYDPAHPASGTDILLDMKETGSKLWLDAQSVLSGVEINFAVSSSQQGKPIIQIQLSSGPGEGRFTTQLQETKVSTWLSSTRKVWWIQSPVNA